MIGLKNIACWIYLTSLVCVCFFLCVTMMVKKNPNKQQNYRYDSSTNKNKIVKISDSQFLNTIGLLFKTTTQTS